MLMMFKSYYPTIIYMLLLISSYGKTEDNKRVPSGFTGVRGKKAIMNEGYGDFNGGAGEQINNYESFIDNPNMPAGEANFDFQKRVPSGFFGMRGKKLYPEDMYKRAPMGFVGSRGKKAAFNDDGVPDEFPKRAQMGFFGMRGKKDFETASNFIEDKRAPSGFFGMRGKKQPSGFFGMRGKKFPYEFRGKFVGVRGKKSTNDNLMASDYYPDLKLGKLEEGLDLNQLMLLLTEQDDIDSNR